MTYRLGKNPPRHDARTLLFEDYRGKLPGTPAACDFMSKVPSYPMFGNDTCGDCAEAAMRHLEMGQTWYSGRGVVPTLRQTIADYSAIGGMLPGDQSTDNGSDLLTALNYYRKQGVITAFAQLATGNWAQLREAVALFGGAYIGVALPDAVVPQDGEDWTRISWFWNPSMSPNQANGHCVPVMKYTSATGDKGGFVSWAALMEMDRDFYENVSDEAFIVVSDGWDQSRWRVAVWLQYHAAARGHGRGDGVTGSEAWPCSGSR